MDVPRIGAVALLLVVSLGGCQGYVVPPQQVCVHDVYARSRGEYRYELEVRFTREGIGYNPHGGPLGFHSYGGERYSRWLYFNTLVGRVEADGLALSAPRLGSPAGFHREKIDGYVEFDASSVTIRLENRKGAGSIWEPMLNGTYVLNRSPNCALQPTPASGRG